MAQVQAELVLLEIDLQNAMQHLKTIKAGITPQAEVPTMKNKTGFVPGERVEVTWDRELRFGLRNWRSTSTEGKIGTVTSVTAQYVRIHLDGKEYLRGSQPLTKKNHNVRLVTPAEGAELVCVLVGGH